MVKFSHRSVAHSSGVCGNSIFLLYIPVHSVGVRRGNVMLNDDLRVGIYALDLANKANRVSRVFSRS